MLKKLFTLILILIHFSLVAQDDFREKLNINLFPFYHGVASGDPLPNAVILWTRYTNDTLSNDSIKIEWRVATDTTMNNVVTSGFGYTDETKDWTFKVDATGLAPNSYYYYDFKASDNYSLIGRTKTTPIGDVDSVRLGIVSCSSWAHGYFSAYKHLADRNDIDCILHLGDYIYEFMPDSNNSYQIRYNIEPSHVTVTLEDYRLRYSHYRLDKDLRAIHQQHPFIVVWDDHESTENSYKDGAAGHNPATQGSWIDRKNHAEQAFHEWIPIRSPDLNSYQIYRSFEFGDLVNLAMLDTRLEGRDETNNSVNANDTNRTILGAQQFSWLKNNLSTSTKRWNIIGQQVMMSPLVDNNLNVLNYDQWDGYTYERSQLFNFVKDSNINNFVVLTGDVHSSWVHNLPLPNYDESTCTGSIGVEFVGTSITSPSFATNSYPTSLVKLFNPQLQYHNTTKQGYGILDLSKTKSQFDYYYLDDVTDPNSNQYYAIGYYLNDNEKCANLADTMTIRHGLLPLQAPVLPYSHPLDINEKDFVLFGVFPNPTADIIEIQLYNQKTENITVRIFSIDGALLFENNVANLNEGINYLKINIQDFKTGNYILNIQNKDKNISKKIVKI